MKKSKKQLSIIFVVMVFFTTFVGCKEYSPLSNYSGGVVHAKTFHLWSDGGTIKIEIDKEFQDINTSGLDYSKYEVGDTIK